MLGGLGKGLLLRLGAYAVFVCGFLLLFRAFDGSNILEGIGGSVAILAAMWLMVGFRRNSGPARPSLDAKLQDGDAQSAPPDRTSL